MDGKISPDALGHCAAPQALLEFAHFEAQFLGIAEKGGIAQVGLVVIELLRRFPEFSLVGRAFARLGGRLGVRVEGPNGIMPENETNPVAVLRPHGLNRLLHIAAIGTFEVAEFNHGYKRVRTSRPVAVGPYQALGERLGRSRLSGWRGSVLHQPGKSRDAERHRDYREGHLAAPPRQGGQGARFCPAFSSRPRLGPIGVEQGQGKKDRHRNRRCYAPGAPSVYHEGLNAREVH